jgi:hypothetical protein
MRYPLLIGLACITFAEAQISDTPGLGEKRYNKALTDSYQRIDPSKDGWDSERQGEEFSTRLKEFVAALTDGESPDPELLAPDFKTSPLRPTNLDPIKIENITVLRAKTLPEPLKSFVAPEWKEFHQNVKVTRIENFVCEALITIKKKGHQINTTWKCAWTSGFLLKSIQVIDYEEIMAPALLRDVTESVLGKTTAYQDQLLRSTDHWRLRLPRAFGLDAPANHGLAIGDINGDGREDLYLCQQGGLPNRLFVQEADGSLRDISAESNTDILDYCAAALLIDLDNDGDKDLVLSQDFKIIFFENLDGKGHFELVFGNSTRAQSFSLSAADIDEDGFLDVYICGYNPSFSAARSGALGEPVPFHDANNGGPNMLWRNKGDWNFEDIAEKVGLEVDNTRFSFAASWEDYDNDGDLDLYVANDFGRNCLYQNQGMQQNGLPFFKNIAGSLNLEDTSAGMSTNWGDINQDGRMDLYISNMFSSAGNRITFQNQFKTDADQSVRSHYQRMARGNTLFQGNSDGSFTDVSMTTQTTMARWSWGSTFTDLNNDGWLDILAANGFITAGDTGDL